MLVDLKGNELDQDHQIQLNFIEILCECICTNRDSEKIEMILEQFISFTRNHFEAEKLMMDHYEYPDAEPHLREHDNLLKLVEETCQALGKHRGDDLLQEISMVQDRLRFHIGSMDEALEIFITQARFDATRRAS